MCVIYGGVAGVMNEQNQKPDQEQNINLQKQPPTQAPLAGQEQPGSFKEALHAIPQKAMEAIDSGTGNDIINEAQNIIENIVSSPFKGCKVLSQLIVLMLPQDAEKVAMRGYIVAVAIVVLSLVSLLIDTSVEVIIRDVVMLAAALVLNMILNSKAKGISDNKTQRIKKRKKDASNDDDVYV